MMHVVYQYKEEIESLRSDLEATRNACLDYDRKWHDTQYKLDEVLKQRDELVAALKQITNESWGASLIAKAALAKVGADKTGEMG